MKLPVAVQLYSVRDEMAEDFEGTIRKMKELGYDGVEFAGLFDREPQEVKRICEEIGINPVSAHVPYYDMLENPQKVLADYAEIGCKYVAVPYLTEECRPGTDGWASTVEGIRNSTIDEDLLKTELDTCWVKVAGENPAEYIKKYSGRSPVVHLKDFRMGQQTGGALYKLIGIDDAGDEKQESSFCFRPVGYGEQDFGEILAACEEAGSEWVVVEQDEPSDGETRIESVKLSREYLSTLGW